MSEETFTPRGQKGRAFAVHSQDLERVRGMTVAEILKEPAIYKKCLTCYRWFTDETTHEAYHGQRDASRRKPR